MNSDKYRARLNERDKYFEYDILKILSLFEEKGWDPQSWIVDNKSIFDRYVKRINMLKNEEQRNLFVDLTNNFLWIKEEQYNDYLIPLFNSFVHKYFVEKESRIWVFPIVKDKSVYNENILDKKTSGCIVFKMLRTLYVQSKLKIGTTNVLWPKNFQEVLKRRKKGDFLLLVDDYIGTGQTVSDELKVLTKEGFSYDSVFIMSMTGTERSIIKLKNLGCITEYGISLKRGITDYYSEEEAAYKLQIVRGIDTMLKNKGGYSKESESLISLMRTPNNTFAVFWKNYKKNYAPFPRLER